MSNFQKFTTIFLHIPKTAGTTLRVIIDNIYNNDSTYYVYPGNKSYVEIEDFDKLSKKEKKKFQFVCGHLDFGFHKHLPQQCKYITVLRDPVNYTTSLFHHLLQKENARNDKHVAAFQKRYKDKGLTLQDFITEAMHTDVDNKQTRVLSGERCGFGQVTGEMLETAKRNLREHFAAVGFTERFDESVILFQKILGWPTPFYARQNVSKKRSSKADLPQETLEIIRRQNEFDIELYRFAQDLFDEQVEKQGPSFQQDVADFKIANRFAEELLQDQLAKGVLQKQIDDLKNSLSWRVTAPMRKTLEIINKLM